ncbi:MAG TPA: ergothioneine biosynthesis protein EgtC [Gammaproteobacteria bacterium]|nr:ergothioneine biosynthesis protein EgtC [Gammaproteobacteria bacterium]
MCRIAAYMGAPISLGHFLLQPPHSLYRQSWDARELQTATVNADGFGVGWLDDRGRPASYTNTAPIWADPNLSGLGRSLVSPIWLGNVRSATPGMTVNQHNTQPFADEQWLYAHNGFVDNFTRGLRPRLQQWLDVEIQAGIQGTTDSEYLFALLRQILTDEPEVPAALRQACSLIETWAPGERALLSLVMTDGLRLYALRHAFAAEPATLYYSTDTDGFPDGQLVASEPLDEAGIWHAIPPGHMLILDPERPAELLEL